jgi:hypothetical protein
MTKPKTKTLPRALAPPQELRPWVLTLREGAVRTIMATQAEIVFAGGLALHDDDGLVAAFPAGVWHSISRPHADVDGEPVVVTPPRKKPAQPAAEPRQTLHLAEKG